MQEHKFMTLDQYTEEYGVTELSDTDKEKYEQQEAAAQKAEADRTEALRLKENIALQLQQGNPPQYALYAALKCIGLLTDDEAWAQKGMNILTVIYGNLEQQSFISDKALETEKLTEQATQYRERLQKQIRTQTRKCENILQALNDITATLNQQEPQDKG